jgi:hypothetical protein
VLAATAAVSAASANTGVNSAAMTAAAVRGLMNMVDPCSERVNTHDQSATAVGLCVRTRSRSDCAACPARGAQIDNYRHVVEHGSAQSFAQVHAIDGRADIVIHRVVRTGDGVTVALTNLSANRRIQALRLDECAAAGIEQ